MYANAGKIWISILKKVYTRRIAVRKADAWVFDQGRDFTIVALGQAESSFVAGELKLARSSFKKLLKGLQQPPPCCSAAKTLRVSI